MHRSTSAARRACAVGTTIALIGLTTGLGMFSATAAYADAAPTTQVADGTQPATGTTSGTTDTSGTTGDTNGTTTTSDSTGTSGDTGTDGATGTTGSTTGGTDASGTAGNDAGTATDTSSTGTGTGTTTGTTGTTTTTGTTAKTNPPVRIAAAPSNPSKATLNAPAKVGTQLSVSTPDLDSPLTYAWTVGGAPASIKSTYVVQEADLGKVISVTVTDGTGATATASSDPVQEQDVVLAGKPDDLVTVEITAGEELHQDFPLVAGTGTVTYSITASKAEQDADAADGTADDTTTDTSTKARSAAVGVALDDDEDACPEFPGSEWLPCGTTFDPATGTLGGKPISAGPWDFTLTVSNGTSEDSRQVELDVAPGAPAGIVASATDISPDDYWNDDFPTGAFWIITWDGDVTGIHANGTDDPQIVEHDHLSVRQEASLWIDGNAVDAWGNDTTDWDGWDGEGEPPHATVTSDQPTDVIGYDDQTGGTKVTFPHASTHNLTISAQEQSLTVPVEVIPVVTTPVVSAPAPAPRAAATTTTTTTGRLAYTGSDALDVLPWALGLLAAGVGLLGLRTARRRSQR